VSGLLNAVAYGPAQAQRVAMRRQRERREALSAAERRSQAVDAATTRPRAGKDDLRGRVPAHAAHLLGLSVRELGAALRDPDNALTHEPRVRAVLAARLWCQCAPTPLSKFGSHAWRHEIWTADTPYTVDGLIGNAPTEPTTVYRGGSARGWSWSPDIGTAYTYAAGLGGRERLHAVWVADAPPGAVKCAVPVFADTTTGNTLSLELVCDPLQLVNVRQLDPHELEGLQALPVLLPNPSLRLRTTRPNGDPR
jgi:hypothetical protein